MRISDWSSDVCSSDLHEPEILVRALRLPEDEIWRCHQAAKSGLVARVKSLTGVSLDPAAPILGFARRMTSYKRPMLIFSDLDRLARVASRPPFQIVMAGKAHPRDREGREIGRASCRERECKDG